MNKIPKSDLLGLHIARYQSNGLDEPAEVWIDGAFDHLLYPSVFFRTYRQMNHLERLALKLCRGKVLDVGAGAGCHSLILQHKGMDVTALDASKGCSLVMRSRGVRHVEEKQILKYQNKGFDTILLLMNGLGIGGSRSEALRILRHLKSKLNVGGQILTDSTDINYTMAEQPLGKEFEKVQMRLVYKVQAVDMSWYYPSQDSLVSLANGLGFKCEIIKTDSKHRFLAQITI